MEEKIKKIMADVFLVDVEDINQNTSPETIERWDSLAQLNLVTAFEEEFNIVLENDQIIQMLNYKLIVEILRETINKINE